MRYLKLTTQGDNGITVEAYINPQQIEYFFHEEGMTHTKVSFHDEIVHVSETTEEIISLLETL